MPDKDTDTRYGHRSGSGANEPKGHERKEQREDWRPRQGGDQTREDDAAQGKLTRGEQVTANLPHLEGSEQGPQ